MKKPPFHEVGLSPEEKRARLAKILAVRASAAPSPVALSYGQRALWLLHQLVPGSAAYNLMFAARVTSKVDPDMLRRAIGALTRRHSILRTVFFERDGKPYQQIQDQAPACLEVVDASAWESDEILQRIEEEADRPFDLERGPVMRATLFSHSDNNSFLLLTAHHIVSDFWSLEILVKELAAEYAAPAGGTNAVFPPLSHDYSAYVRLQTEQLAGPEGERLFHYWKNQLSGPLPSLDLPTDYPRPPIQTFRGKIHTFDFDQVFIEKLRRFARDENTTLFTVLLAAYQTLLFRYTGQEDILIGSPTAGRNRTGWEGLVGYFVNPVVLRADLSGHPRFRDLLVQARQTVLGALAHQDYPFSLLVERLQAHRDSSRSQVFQASFVWDRARLQRRREVERQEALVLEPIAVGQRGAPFDLTLTVVEVGGGLSGLLQYNTDLFEAATAARMAGHFQALLEGIIDQPDCPISDLPFLTGVERQQLLIDWNNTASEYPRHACLHELIDEQTQSRPEAVAVVFEDQHLTYQQLRSRSNQLAHYLQTLGVGPEVLVGIGLERSLDMVVALLAVLKAGGAYVPLDPALPRERLAFMLEDSGIKVLLTQQHLREGLPAKSAIVVCMDTDQDAIGAHPDTLPPCGVTPENLAYVIYTSGSTGKPKGVGIPHRALVNFLLSMQREPGLESTDTLLAVTTLSFDIAGLEMYLPLLVGGRVVIASRQVSANGTLLIRALEESDATVMQATPATWRMLLDAGWKGIPGMKILCGGESLPRPLADQLLERGSCVWNLYGPTETTIWSSVCRIQAGDSFVPLGKPIANTQFYILDQRLQPVPIGVASELCIGGDGLARGYLNRPELTATKFFPDPFSQVPGARLYKTGDLARYLASGEIEYLGRMDHQVKLHGFRIELEEIESVLGEHPAVRERVVIDREVAPGDRRLVAYLVLNGEPRPTLTDLRNHLKQKLPDYMAPSFFVFLDALPLTPHGKVDRKALPAPDSARPDLKHLYTAPSTPSEKILAKVWQQVLGIDRVGIHDNFFDLGGASIQSLEAAARAREEGLEVTPEMLFRYQTIAELASAAGPPLVACETSAATLAPQLQPEISGSRQGNAISQTPPVKVAKRSVVIESLGVYLPSKVVSTEEVLAGCRTPIEFPLEKMTGIRTRRVVGDQEFSIDLAKKAAADCLARSRFRPEEIGLVVCCNISRQDGPLRFNFEPGTAIRIKKAFGLSSALAFDISNACAGMFTAISLVEAFLRTGAIESGLVVSGEYISHLADTAQKEIEGFMDSRLACLTVGDAGAALLLELAPDDRVGFQDLDLFTLGRYSSLCIAKATDRDHGGAIMYTDSIRQNAVSIKQSVQHSAIVIERGKWEPESIQHIIMHQTSETALRDAAREINNKFKQRVCHEGNTFVNLAERGNTASTSHFVAVMDGIASGRIQSKDRVVFGVTGSGQTVGTGLYSFDDLPDRMRARKTHPTNAPSLQHGRNSYFPRQENGGGVRIESIGLIQGGQPFERDAVRLAKMAAEDCLSRSRYSRNDIALLLHTGVYRNEFLSEPAMAAILAGELDMNAETRSTEGKSTFAFDVINGSLGFLNAVCTGSQFIESGKCLTVMITASEIENNADLFHHPLRGVKETGSAVILDRVPAGTSGLGGFLFKDNTRYVDSLMSYSFHDQGKTCLKVERSPEFEAHCLEGIPAMVRELLELEGVDPTRIAVVFPPQMSPAFVSQLKERLGFGHAAWVDLAEEGKDYFTSSVPYTFQHALSNQLAGPGDIGLLIGVGAGIQAGCALYHF
jgi:amino acid adenylation domain-containing protein